MRNMINVKEIFALRKQGKIEEAYEAIRPIYKEHKGKFTTLCMFWVASDVFKLRLEQGRVEEAEKIYRAMLRLLPFIEDDDKAASKREQSDACISSVECEQARPEVKHSAAGFMRYAEGRLIKASEKFRKRYFAIRDKKKRVDIPSDNPSKDINPCDPNNPCSQEVERFSDRFSSDFEAQRPTNAPCIIAVPRLTGASKSAGQTKVLACIKAHPGLKVPGLEAETGIPAKSIERYIKVLIERNLIEHRGSKKTGGYHAL